MGQKNKNTACSSRAFIKRKRDACALCIYPAAPDLGGFLGIRIAFRKACHCEQSHPNGTY
jgi:hypothetical protein